MPYSASARRVPTANGINLNLTARTAVAAIGTDQLARERQVDGERRRSAHVGSWHPMDPSRWRSAIENYTPSVQLGNQTALNTAASAFGSYLSMIHNRIHPIFADSFLGSLDNLPASHPMNNQDLSTEVEIILDQESGKVVRMGVTKFSGITAFDIAALDSVKRAAPFGTPPREIVSPDGKVYLHWEFHRNQYACSTLNARPFILKVQPSTAPTEVTPPPAPSDPTEASPRERHGQNTRRRGSAFAQN
ncbi:MAG: TonB C-terminal domain-containing protein [Pseudomonadota bacterium]